MNGCFKPLRHKLGIATLLLAGAFAVGWVRSRFFLDSLELTSGLTGKKITFDFQSIASQIGCNVHSYRFQDPEAGWLHVYYLNHDLRIETFSDSDRLKLHFDRAGFRYGTITGTIHPDSQLVYDTSILRLPYYSIVTPLTLLSAWLLLSKDRQPKTAQPAA